MKTSTPEVRCDGCGLTIPLGSPRALFLTLRGIEVKHMKRDFCSWACFAFWAMREAQSPSLAERPTVSEEVPRG